MKNKRLLFAGVSAVALSAVGLGSCIDVAEPEGPLRVTRLTLKDTRSRNVTVFSDSAVPPDCTAAEHREKPQCQNDIFGDMFSLKKSPPTPDSARDLRVVFNKLPLKAGGKDIEEALKAAQDGKGIIDLQCEGCTGIPPLRKRVILVGSDLSLDPRSVPYGPALALDIKDQGRYSWDALEPETDYQVVVQADVAGRDGLALDAASAALHLRFRTEPLRLLQVGVGSSRDVWVYSQADQTGYDAGALAQDGVIALKLNAPLDDSDSKSAKLNATLRKPDGSTAQVPFRLVLAGGEGCTPGDRRTVYLVPDQAGGQWGTLGEAGALTLEVPGMLLRDLSQAAMHPAGQGKHRLAGSVSVRAALGAQKADKAYGGLTWTGSGCPVPVGTAPAPADMAAPMDLATVDGGVPG